MRTPHTLMDAHAFEGFTLLEVLAVMLLTSIVMGVALNFYVDLSRASRRAADHTREIRRAVAILDRMARDFEATLLVRKPAEDDPIGHPWLFLAESATSEIGADHVKFMTRNHRPRDTTSHESDLAVVSYTTRRNDRGDLELLRWSSPRLPEGLDRDFPSPLDHVPALLSDEVDAFGVTFLDAGGAWKDTWDSSQLVESSELPAAVKIRVAMLTADGSPAVTYERQVLLPVRPLDLEVLLDPEAQNPQSVDADGDDDSDDPDGSNGFGRGSGAGPTDEDLINGVPTVAYCISIDGIRLGPKVRRLSQLGGDRDAPITSANVRSFLSQNQDLVALLRPVCQALLR